MHKKIDFSQPGGLYVYQDTLEYLQSTYSEAIAGIVGIFGEKVVVSGCEVNGATVSAGWLAINGELLPMQAGALAAKISIVETPTAEQFADGSAKNIYKNRIAQMGNIGDYSWSDFVRATPYKNLFLPGDIKEVDCTADYIAANFDATGLGVGERKGWAVCNGQNGTRDRGGRVPVGYSWIAADPGDNVWDAIYRTMGGTGGEKKHQLSIAEMPSHSHKMNGNSNGDSGGSGGVMTANYTGYEPINDSNVSGGVTRRTVENTGGGQAHENRQPFIVSLFIQKI